MKNYSELDEAVYLTGITTIVAWFGMAFYIAYVTAYDMFQKFRSERMVKLTQKHLKEKNMKTIAFAILMLGLASQSKAQTMTNAQAVKLTVPYLTACSSVTLLSATPTELTGNLSYVSTAAAGVSWIKVTNVDAAATVYCSENPSVSATGINAGDPVYSTTIAPSNNRQDWRISGTQKWYCISSVNGSNIRKCLLR